MAFTNHLARGRLYVPLFIDICGDLERSTTRERKILDPDRVWELLYSLSVAMTPEDSFILLRELKPFWSDTHERLFDIYSWYYVICQLVRNISGTEQNLRTSQYKEFENLAYIEGETSDRSYNQLIRRVRKWAPDNNCKRLVNPIFRMLGAENLVERFCKEVDQGLREADETEQHLAQIAIQTLQQIVPDYIFLPVPAVWIGSCQQSEQDPLVFAKGLTDSPSKGRFFKQQSGNTFHQAVRPRNQLDRIVMDTDDFLPDAFDHTFVKIADKLLHIYGSSRSSRMNVLFTNLGAWIINHADIINIARAQWRRDADVHQQELSYNI